MTGLTATSRRTSGQGFIKAALTLSSLIILANIVYFGLYWTKSAFGDQAGLLAIAVAVMGYVALVRVRAGNPDLPADDPRLALVRVPDFYDVARTGLHYLIPVVVLIWCLMVEEMSPGLSAFWGVIAMASLVLTQKPLTALFRGETALMTHWRQGIHDVFGGLEAGARNMIGVGIATATAGIIVGAVTLTGVGLVMTELVELLSGGSIVIMLALVAVICILLGTGLPTTASYVVVATLMAPVVVELAAQNDLAVPLIAVHMFVFYFGLMADVSPPVGLAAYAAGAIAGADPMKVGWQATWYEMRTALLPFIFIFNPAVLMIDIGGPLHFVLVVGCAAIAMTAFCAACQGFFFTRNRIWETLALLLVCFTLFRPNFWMDRLVPPRIDRPASEIGAIIDATPGESALLLRIESTDIMGDDVLKVARLKLGNDGDAAKRLNAAGLSVSSLSAAPMITAVRPGSEAARLKLRPGDKIGSVLVPNPRPEPFWFAIPALALLGFVALLQRQRRMMLEPEAARS